jgi:hypothetical protein
MIDYLKLVAEWRAKNGPNREFRWQSYEELVLELGEVFEEAVLADQRGEMKQCYRNSWMAAEPGLTYYEGFALSIIPVMHAWLVNSDGVVVETTWEEVGETYIGVPVSRKAVTATGYWGLMPNDYLNDFALLREGHGLAMRKGAER